MRTSCSRRTSCVSRPATTTSTASILPTRSSGSSKGPARRCRTIARRRTRTAKSSSASAQELDQVELFLSRQGEVEAAVVVVDDGAQSGIAAVVVEAALRLRDDSPQRRRSVAERRGAIRLEVVDADLFGGVEVPAGVAEGRRHVAIGAASLAIEERPTPARGRAVE